MSQQGCKLKESQTVCGKNIEGIAKKFVGTRPEMVQSPPPLENLGEFGDADEVRCLLFERVESDGELPVGGFNHDQSATQVFLRPGFTCGNRAQERLRHDAVQIDAERTAICLNVLLRHVP